MTKTISPPIRILAIVGVVAAVALGAFVFMHMRSSSDSAAPDAVPAANAKPAQTTAHKSASALVVSKPKIVLLPGLPASIAHKLHYSRVVVVSMFSRNGSGDKAAVLAARTGAKSAHAGFVAVNLGDERTAKRFGTFAGTATAPPAVIVVKRPGKITNRFDGFADSEVVAQAATNAGAHASK